MKKLFLTMIAIVFATMSFAAGPASFTAAGCDASALKPVLSSDGVTVLYWQNTGGKGCDAQKRGSIREEREREAELLAQ